MPSKHAQKPLDDGPGKTGRMSFQRPAVKTVTPLVAGAAEVRVTLTLSCDQTLTHKTERKHVRVLFLNLIILVELTEHRTWKFILWSHTKVGWCYLWLIGHHTFFCTLHASQSSSVLGREGWGAWKPWLWTALSLPAQGFSHSLTAPGEWHHPKPWRWPWCWMLPLVSAGHCPWSQRGNAWQRPGHASLSEVARLNDTVAGSSVEMLKFEI